MCLWSQKAGATIVPASSADVIHLHQRIAEGDKEARPLEFNLMLGRLKFLTAVASTCVYT